ncbi:Cation/acetate symporter ActP [Streptomyces alboniger]
MFVLATLVITVWAGRQTKDAADFYAGGRQFSAFQNGLAVSGDYMSAASFLGIAGAIALFGYDGFLYSIGFLVAWLVALLLVAEPLRNSGRYSLFWKRFTTQGALWSIYGGLWSPSPWAVLAGRLR